MKRVTAPFTGALMLAALVTSGTTALSAWADDAMDQHSHHHHTMEADDPHSHHHHMMAEEIKHSLADYELPQVKLVRDDGKSISLTEELNDGNPVIMNFIFTSCTAVCPVTSKTFSMLQEGLGGERDKVHMVSISIDPEQDTPSVLKKYAEKYGAGTQWHFYTGTVAASVAAFDVYRGDKMNHTPVTLLRAAPGKPWLRVEGFASADDLLHQYHDLVAAK